jgi:sterol desaturase/sphingolipid hydroxylase (fatty acid hydroxylase superfamily)
MKVNFGAFFNIWDRWMGTFLDEQTPPVETQIGKHLATEDFAADLNARRNR